MSEHSRSGATTGSGSPPERGWSRKPYVVIALVFWVIPSVVLGIVWLVVDDHNPTGQCEGIGWGCTPTPKDSVVFLWLFVGAPFAGLGLLAVVVTAVVQHLRARRH